MCLTRDSGLPYPEIEIDFHFQDRRLNETDKALRPETPMLLLLAPQIVLAAALAPTPVTAPAPDPAHFALRGRVLDPTLSPIPGAHVTVLRDGRTAGPSAVTDPVGSFALTLDPGAYTVLVEAPGFTATAEGLSAAGGSSESHEYVLKVARFRESVTVSAPGGYEVAAITSATRTLTPLRDVPQSVTVATRDLMKDQLMLSMGDVIRYVPGITTHQGENNRDQVIIRGNNSSADFFLNGVRDDVQYYRDLYNLERVEALKGPNAMIFGRGGGGGVVNRVTKEAGFLPLHEFTLQGGAYDNKRITGDVDRPLSDNVAFRLNAMYEDSGSFRQAVGLERYGLNPTVTIAASTRTKVTLGYEHLHDTRVADRGIPSFQGRPADVDVSTYYGNPDDSHVRAGVDLASAAVEHRSGRLILRNRTL